MSWLRDVIKVVFHHKQFRQTFCPETELPCSRINDLHHHLRNPLSGACYRHRKAMNSLSCNHPTSTRFQLLMMERHLDRMRRVLDPAREDDDSCGEPSGRYAP